MKIWKYLSSAALPINCCWDCLWLTLPPIWSEFACSSDFLSLNTIALSSLIHHLIVFHCPLADLNTVCFPSQGPLYCPKWSTCQGVLRSVDVISVKDFANSIDVFLVWQIFLVLESNLIFQRSCLFKSYWNEIKEMSIFEKTFWKSSFFIKDPTHVIRNIQSFDFMYFENRNWPVIRIKWFFFHCSLYPF